MKPASVSIIVGRIQHRTQYPTSQSDPSSEAWAKGSAVQQIWRISVLTFDVSAIRSFAVSDSNGLVFNDLAVCAHADVHPAVVRFHIQLVLLVHCHGHRLPIG